MRSALFTVLALILLAPDSHADFTIIISHSPDSITSLAEADELFAFLPLPHKAGATIVTGLSAPFIDHFDAEGDTGEGSGRFTNNLNFPGTFDDDDDDRFAMLARGFLHIENAGEYTFGANSDDGARLRIDTGAGLTDVIVRDGVTPPGDQFGILDFDTSGIFELEFLYFENTGQATVELFAAPGTPGPSSSSYRLLGDVANGGLAVSSVPEPSSLALLTVASAVGVAYRRRCKIRSGQAA